MAEKLWEKGIDLNAQVHEFTVGNDPEIDREIAYWDAIGSAAHAKMLRSINMLTHTECSSLLAELEIIAEKARSREFIISQELEDCHSAIEAELTSQVGVAGKKIHIGRSRNDQVLAAMRLYLRDRCLRILEELSLLSKSFLGRARELQNIPMPGYTHMQPAMPSSVALWLHAFSESTLTVLHDGIRLMEGINSNPLGAAAGFGSPIPIDRSLTTKLLGFSRSQRNPIHIQNSRGRKELKFVRWCSDIVSVLEKLAWDFILFSTREYDFFSIPDAFTTGSSIMPQKKNPDVLELLRGRASRVRGSEAELKWVIGKLPSNYHRDFQYTKEPVIRTANSVLEMLPITRKTVEEFSVNEDKLRAAMTDELYATYDAYRKVLAGLPFRDAYKETAKEISSGTLEMKTLKRDFEPVQKELESSMIETEKCLEETDSTLAEWNKNFSKIERDIFRT